MVLSQISTPTATRPVVSQAPLSQELGAQASSATQAASQPPQIEEPLPPPAPSASSEAVVQTLAEDTAPDLEQQEVVPTQSTAAEALDTAALDPEGVVPEALDTGDLPALAPSEETADPEAPSEPGEGSAGGETEAGETASGSGTSAETGSSSASTASQTAAGTTAAASTAATASTATASTATASAGTPVTASAADIAAEEAAARMAARQAQAAYRDEQILQSLRNPSSSHIVDMLKDMASTRAKDAKTAGEPTEGKAGTKAETSETEASASPSTTSGDYGKGSAAATQERMSASEKRSTAQTLSRTV